MADLSKDALLFAVERKRMCKTHYKEGECVDCAMRTRPCIIGSTLNSTDDERHILEVVQKWHDENPRKTYAQDYRERNPYAMFCEDECYPVQVCRAYAYRNISLRSDCDGLCRRCWNEPMEEK